MEAILLANADQLGDLLFILLDSIVTGLLIGTPVALAAWQKVKAEYANQINEAADRAVVKAIEDGLPDVEVPAFVRDYLQTTMPKKIRAVEGKAGLAQDFIEAKVAEVRSRLGRLKAPSFPGF